MDRRSSRLGPIQFGMHIYDVHEQLLGTVVLTRPDHFVMRQQLAISQLVAVPLVAVTGVVGGLVFLSLTPGEIELFCRILETSEAGAPHVRLLPRTIHPQRLAEQM